MISKIEQIREEVNINLEKNFAECWIKILTHNVLRYQKISQQIGPLDGLIVQVIAWHHYLSTISEINEEVSSFNSSLQLWQSGQSKKNNEKKLTISLVSQLTSIPFETTRRKINKMVKNKWITFTKENGIVFNPTSDLNDKIVNDIHPYEKELVKDFLVTYISTSNNLKQLKKL